jgi:hypothetical protein
MKLNFLCANHREWLQGRPDQALHWCANSYDTGRSLSERDHWDEALVHMGCAFETAEIVLTTRAIALMTGLEWFVQTLEGLTQALEKSGRAEAATEIRQAAICRLRNEAMLNIPPEVEARIYMHITRLHSQNRQHTVTPRTSRPAPIRVGVNLEEIVYH